MNLEQSFTSELLKVGFPVINRMGTEVPVPEIVSVHPWNPLVKEFKSVNTRTIGSKFNIFLHLNNERQGVPLPYGYATFDVVEDGQLYGPGAYLSQRLIFSQYDAFVSRKEERYREAMIKAQLEAVAVRFARNIQEVAFQSLFNGINS